MAAPPPRAPTFPTLDDSVHEVDDSDFIDQDDSPPTAPPPRSAPPMASSHPSGSLASDVPVVNLPTAPRSGRVAAILLWRDPKATALVLVIPAIFFYATIVRRLDALAALGLALFLHAVFRFFASQVARVSSNPLPALLQRPPDSQPLLPKETAAYYAQIVADELNDVQHTIRQLLYCDSPAVATAVALSGLFLYLLAKVASMPAVLLLATVALFTLPLAYHRNRKQVDDAVARASDQVSRHVDHGRKILEDRSAALLEKAPPAARDFAGRVGFTPKKKQ